MDVVRPARAARKVWRAGRIEGRNERAAREPMASVRSYRGRAGPNTARRERIVRRAGVPQPPLTADSGGCAGGRRGRREGQDEVHPRRDIRVKRPRPHSTRRGTCSSGHGHGADDRCGDQHRIPCPSSTWARLLRRLARRRRASGTRAAVPRPRGRAAASRQASRRGSGTTGTGAPHQHNAPGHLRTTDKPDRRTRTTPCAFSVRGAVRYRACACSRAIEPRGSACLLPLPGPSPTRARARVS